MATILELEVFVDPKSDSINGEAYFAGEQRGIGNIFNTGDRVRALETIHGGLTGTETNLKFNYRPAAAGLELLDKVIWFNQPTPEVSDKWQKQRPVIVKRIVQASPGAI